MLAAAGGEPDTVDLAVVLEAAIRALDQSRDGFWRALWPGRLWVVRGRKRHF